MGRKRPNLRSLVWIVLLIGACPSSDAKEDARPGDVALDRSTLDGPRPERAPLDVGLDASADMERHDMQSPDLGPPEFTVHLKKPGSWTDANIHYWETWPGNLSTTWPGVKMTVSNGWYSYTLSQQTSAGIVFHDGAGNQTADLWREREGWFVPVKTVRGLLVGRWYDRNPDLYPRVSASPPGGSLHGGAIVTLEAEGSVSTSRYTLDGSDPKIKGTAYTGGTKIAVGQALTVGQTLTLRLWANGQQGDHARTYAFTRMASPSPEVWDGTSKPTSVSQTGRWVTLSSFPSPQGLQARTVVILLPEDYQTSTNEHYPVIYFHDGQNLVDNGAAGSEWMVDERYDELVAEGLVRSAIIVGIYSTTDREAEYAGCNVLPKKDQYANWVVHTLKPYIDAHYRTMAQAEHTTTLGSSYGGLISHYIAWNFTSVFGNALTISTQFAFCTGPAALSELQSYTGAKKPIRYWIDSGSDEGAQSGGGRSDYIERNRIFAESLAQASWSEMDDLVFLEIPGGQHNQWYWAKRIKKVLYFLLGHEPPRLARMDLRTFQSSVSVAGYTYASVDLTYENDFKLTKIFADNSPAFSLASSDPSVATMNTTTGQVVGKKSGTVQLTAGYQSLSVSGPLVVK